MITIDEKVERVEVKMIESPGKYFFSRDGKWRETEFGGNGPKNTLFTKSMRVTYDSVPVYLESRFKGMKAQKFVEASLIDGEYTPASLEFSSNWSDFAKGVQGFGVYNGEISRISTGENGFEIEDVGNLKIVKNKLVAGKPRHRDGKLDFTLDRYSDYHEGMLSWRASMEYWGKNPGIFVRAAIDHINSEKERVGATLWKAKKEDIFRSEWMDWDKCVADSS